MPRRPRLVVPDIPVHIVQRGNDRMACFRQDGDYLVYLALLRQACQKFRCLVHAYCLMTNHVHLLVTPATPRGCADLMHRVANRYAHYFNGRHQRTGTLWDGRYRSCLVESGEYLLACYRYIELNPVRAGLVPHAAAYPWSSHAANTGKRADPLVSPHGELERIGRNHYARLVDEAIGPELLRDIRQATNAGFALASDSFRASIAALTGRRAGPAKSGRPSRQPAEKSEPGSDLFSGGGVS